MAGGLASLGLLWTRRFRIARVTAAVTVGALLWGWAVVQYPELLVGSVTVADAAANPTTLAVLLVGLRIGATLGIPSLVLLYVLFQRPGRADS